MTTSATAAKTEKTIVSTRENRTVTNNHKKAAKHLEAAANHHLEAVKHQQAGNHEVPG